MTHDDDGPIPFRLVGDGPPRIGPTSFPPTRLDEDGETFTTLEAQASTVHTAAAAVLYTLFLILLAAAPAVVILVWKAAL